MAQPTMTPPPDDASADLSMHEASRREKLRKLRELGIDPWGPRFADRQKIGDIRVREGEIVVEPLVEGQRSPVQHGPTVRAAGRLVLQRRTGKLIFADIRDWSGQIQFFFSSRRRHTRLTCDWSSDVCSSD